MKPENKAFLEANRHHWNTLNNAFYMRHLDGHTRSEMQRIMGEEFQHGYTADLWCPTCVADMVRALYQRFEAWEVANPPVVVEPEIPVIPDPPVEPTGPAITVRANFPSNRKGKKQ